MSWYTAQCWSSRFSMTNQSDVLLSVSTCYCHRLMMPFARFLYLYWTQMTMFCFVLIFKSSFANFHWIHLRSMWLIDSFFQKLISVFLYIDSHVGDVELVLLLFNKTPTFRSNIPREFIQNPSGLMSLKVKIVIAWIGTVADKPKILHSLSQV